MFTENLLCEPPWTSTEDNISSITEGSMWARGLGLLFIPLTTL